MNTQPIPPHHAPVCVLVVDDHPNTASTLARAISRIDPQIEVIAANDGESALEKVQGKAVDVLITDMMMTGMNGLELVEKMQAHPGGRRSSIILVTAYDVPGLRISARRLNVDEVIIKPVRPERIYQLVASAIQNIHSASPRVLVPETRHKFKILVADDLQDNVSLLIRYLTNEGYACLSAFDGEEALQKVRAEMPDMVLLDINMPLKDGFEVLQDIRSDPAVGHIPVIVLTAARLEPMDMQSALNMGADDYVTKPFDRRELLARIRTRLRVKEAEDIIRRRNRELNLLPEIGRELSARLDMDELSDVVLRRTVETLGAFMGHLVLLDETAPLYKTHHFSCCQTSQTHAEMPPLESLLAQLNETRQGCIIADAHLDSRWHVAPDDPSRAMLVVPMFGRFGLLGVLALAHEQAEYFSLDHLLLLQAIASQAAIALENARLYANLQQSQVRAS